MKTADVFKNPVLAIELAANELAIMSDTEGLVNLMVFKDGIFSMNTEKFHVRDTKDSPTMMIKIHRSCEMFPIETIDKHPIFALGSFEQISLF